MVKKKKAHTYKYIVFGLGARERALRVPPSSAFHIHKLRSPRPAIRRRLDARRRGAWPRGTPSLDSLPLRNAIEKPLHTSSGQ